MENKWIEAWFDSLKQKWILIWKVYLLNSIIVPVLLLNLSLFVKPIFNDIKQYASSRPAFNTPLSQFFPFFRDQVLDIAWKEELHYRIYAWLAVSAIWLCIYVGYRLKAKDWLEKYSFEWFLIWFLVWNVATISNLYWVKGHSATFNYVFIPLFIAGLSWNWLIIKTGKLWPAIVSHMLANTSLYFLIKMLQFFQIKPF